MLHNPLADSISVIKNAERIGRGECTLRHASNILKEILGIMKKKNYIGDFRYIEDGRGGEFKIKLIGKINDCKTIIPRFFIKKDEYEKWEKQFLPATNVGILIVSTNKGVVCHRDVKGKVGGVLIAYVY